MQFATKGLFAPRYEEQNAGTQTEVYDSAAKDEHLKRMPTGQMEALVTDHKRGAILEHIHIRQGFQSFLVEDTAAAFYPPLNVCRKRSLGLDLTFSGMPLQLTDTRTRRTTRRNSFLGGLR